MSSKSGKGAGRAKEKGSPGQEGCAAPPRRLSLSDLTYLAEGLQQVETALNGFASLESCEIELKIEDRNDLDVQHDIRVYYSDSSREWEVEFQ